MFTITAVVTLVCATWLGNLVFDDLASDLTKRPMNLNYVCSDVVFIIAATCAAVTSLHSLVHTWT